MKNFKKCQRLVYVMLDKMLIEAVLVLYVGTNQFLETMFHFFLSPMRKTLSETKKIRDIFF